MRSKRGTYSPELMSRSPSLLAIPSRCASSQYPSPHFSRSSSPQSHAFGIAPARAATGASTAADAESQYCYESASRRRRLTHRAEYTPRYESQLRVPRPPWCRRLSNPHRDLTPIPIPIPYSLFPVPRSVPRFVTLPPCTRDTWAARLQGCFIPLVPEARRGRIRHCHVLGT